jgi:hypothetical protein
MKLALHICHSATPPKQQKSTTASQIKDCNHVVVQQQQQQHACQSKLCNHVVVLQQQQHYMNFTI